MYTVIASFDQTINIPNDSININLKITDPIPQTKLQVIDIGSTLSFAGLQEVLIIDETGVANPTHNLLLNPSLNQGVNGINNWMIGAVSGGSYTGGPPLQLYLNNMANSTSYYAYQTTAQTLLCNTYIVPNQKYTASAYIQTLGLTGANAKIGLQWQDGAQNVLSTTYSSTLTGTNAATRFSVLSTAPSNAAYAQVQLILITTSGTNSGAANFTQVQLEPNWFSSNTYPTPACNDLVAGCVQLPNGTWIRQTRLFYGYIDNLKRTYDGKNRKWQVSAIGAMKLFDAVYVSQTYIVQTDQYIIQNALSSTNLNNIVGTGNVQVSVTIDQVVFDLSTMTDVMNQCIDNSTGFNYYVDPYLQLYYVPNYYTLAPYAMSDAPDNLNSFPYYNYTLEDDVTQLKRRITASGGNWVGPAHTDTFTGNGSTKQFTLTKIQPISVTVCTVGGAGQETGINGKDTFAAGFDALLDVPSHYIKFNAAPGNAVAVAVTYTYTSQVRVRETQIAAVGNDIIYFDSKINDTNLATPAAASQRAIAELLQFALSRQIIHFSTGKALSPGQVVRFTSALDSLSQVGFLVQGVVVRNLAAGLYEYQCDAGAYNPDLIAIMKHLHRAVHRSSQMSNQSIQNENLMFADTIIYSETFATTVTNGGATNVYGNAAALYGTTTYGGPSVGDYGAGIYGTAHYAG